MSNHAWCRDVARDEAVRAAEDGRDRPLPTLKECIAGVTESMSGNARGEEMEQGNFAEPAERSVELSKTGDGQSGLRTERVTLEVTHDASRDDPRLIDAVRRIAYAAVEREFRYPGESVRVVSDEEPGRDMGNGVFVASVSEVHAMYGETVNVLTAERDAAIRERESWKLLADRTNERLSAAEARVAELEAASGGGEGEPYMVTASGIPLYRSPPQPRGWLTERDRKTLIDAAVFLSGKGERGMSEAIEWLLARSTPPEVVKPGRWRDYLYDRDQIVVGDQRDAEWLAALAAAGVEVAE